MIYKDKSGKCHQVVLKLNANVEFYGKPLLSRGKLIIGDLIVEVADKEPRFHCLTLGIDVPKEEVELVCSRCQVKAPFTVVEKLWHHNSSSVYCPKCSEALDINSKIIKLDLQGA